MPLQITTINRIYNHSNQTIEVVNLESGKGRVLTPSQPTVVVNMPIPWMMSDWDFGGHNPHVIQIHLQGTGDYAFIWQKDDWIIGGISKYQTGVTYPDPRAGLQKDLVIKPNNYEIHNAGKGHYKSGPALSHTQEIPSGSRF